MKNTIATVLIVICFAVYGYIESTRFGKLLTFNEGELYYTKSVTKNEADTLGKYCVASGFFDGQRKTIQLDKKDNTYLFRMVCLKEYRNKASYKILCGLMATEISEEVFGGQPTQVHLCDDRLETVTVIDFWRSLKEKNTIFYTKNIDSGLASKLNSYLLSINFDNGVFQLDKKGNSYQLRIIYQKKFINNAEILQAWQDMEIRTNVFDGAAVQLMLCDEYFALMKTIELEK
ncbi:hypothetical protein [Candidatus Uabimicrobium amorphum]|uniref:Uncharacterized protein n=1 Tax=Uabimicrobium amorphum TaxID=2596890 RepID=A0A5S9ISE3_UABAM|nr:hypothetical protein [Candidatus Uabimicrobium amorphum]BBM86561.1 hypothetical protein UABAM_04947 [Candidatus Uabimicrobium amorphum]